MDLLGRLEVPRAPFFGIVRVPKFIDIYIYGSISTCMAWPVLNTCGQKQLKDEILIKKTCCKFIAELIVSYKTELRL